MPVVDPTGARVLVTGANGFIAHWIIRILLEQGYSVRGAVRSLEKGQHLKELYGSYGDRFELSVIADIAKDGAYDDAVRSVDAIIHTASAADLTLVEPEDYSRPAVEGTVGLLESARKFGDKVKRIVVTSSIAAVGFPTVLPTVILDENNWNDEAVEITDAQGRNAHPVIKYSASKVLAERAAWEFYDKNKNAIPWELVTILPSHVWGPPLQVVKGPETLNVSLWLFWDAIANDKSDEDLRGTYNHVHVRDVALSHIAALQKEKAGGERIIVSAGTASTWQGARKIVQYLKPELYSKGILPRIKPEIDTTPSYILNNEKSKRLLGFEYVDEETTIKDTLADFEARGYFLKPVKA